MPASTPRLSAPDYVVLGMLGLGARSGYDVKQLVDVSIRFFWTISHAQIYPSLERLEGARLIRGREEPRGRRPRRVYARTRAGDAALRAWLAEAEPMPFELRDNGMLKLFFADGLDADDADALLAAVRERSAERVATLRALTPEAERAAQEGAVHPQLTLAMGIAFHEAMVSSCDRFARERDSRRRGASTRPRRPGAS